MFQISLPWHHLCFNNACPLYLKSRRDLLYAFFFFKKKLCDDKAMRCTSKRKIQREICKLQQWLRSWEGEKWVTCEIKHKYANKSHPSLEDATISHPVPSAHSKNPIVVQTAIQIQINVNHGQDGAKCKSTYFIQLTRSLRWPKLEV